MVKKVISFFPGGGGNRYLRYCAGEEFQSLGTNYDSLVKNQLFSWRYLLDDEIVCSSDTVLTHCVNQSHMRKKLGDISDIVILNFPMKQCLCREWALNGRHRYAKKNLFTETDDIKKIECYNAIRAEGWPAVTSPQEYKFLPSHIKQEVERNFSIVVQSQLTSLDLDSALATIRWHKKYYSVYPFDSVGCRIINLKDDNVFCKTMADEFVTYENETFDRAWQMVLGDRGSSKFTHSMA